MTDDPRQILDEAGVECPEVEEWLGLEWWCVECNDSHEHTLDAGGRPYEFDVGDAAVLALARLVAKLMPDMRLALRLLQLAHRRDLTLEEAQMFADLDRRWEERDADA